MARVHLGLTDVEFYRLTPRQYDLLVDRHRERTDHLELLSGIVAAAVANWGMRAPKKPLTAADFMPSRFTPKREKRSDKQQEAANIRSVLMGSMKR